MHVLVSEFVLIKCINPFVLEFIIPAEPLKWWRPEDIQSRLVTHLLVPSFSQNGSSKDLSCTAVSQKNCTSFLFFAASLAKDEDGPIS